MNGIIIIPVYQPEPVLEELVEAVYKNGNFPIIVDDGSDEVYQKRFWVLSDIAIVLHHKKNMGKGTAIKTALNYIKENTWSYDVVGIMDADGQHRPEDMERLIYKARSNRNSLILGVRQVDRNMPMRSRFGNQITRRVFRLSSGVYVSDTQSGLRAFDRKLIDFFRKIPGKRYEYEIGVLHRWAKEKRDIVEIPIDTIYKDRGNSTSHFRAVRDSLRIYKELLKFIAVSLSSFCVDFALFLIFLFIWGESERTVAVANILARGISATYNYTMNAHFVFRKETSNQSIAQYLILAAIVLLINNGLLGVYVLIIKNVMVSKIVTELTLFLISFFTQKFIIFKGSYLKMRKKTMREGILL